MTRCNRLRHAYGCSTKLLPTSLQTLHFGEHFNQPWENDGQKLLPDGLHTLYFGADFEQPLKKDGQRLVPDGLRTLTLGRCDNELLVNRYRTVVRDVCIELLDL